MTRIDAAALVQHRYISLTYEKRDDTEVLRAIHAVGFVRRQDLPGGFNKESIAHLNLRFEERGLPKRLFFKGNRLVLEKPARRKSAA